MAVFHNSSCCRSLLIYRKGPFLSIPVCKTAHVLSDYIESIFGKSRLWLGHSNTWKLLDLNQSGKLQSFTADIHHILDISSYQNLMKAHYKEFDDILQ